MKNPGSSRIFSKKAQSEFRKCPRSHTKGVQSPTIFCPLASVQPCRLLGANATQEMKSRRRFGEETAIELQPLYSSASRAHPLQGTLRRQRPCLTPTTI